MSQPGDGAGDEENVAHRAKEYRENQTTSQYEYLHGGRFGFLGNKGKAAFKKFGKRANEREQVLEQTGMPRRIAGPRALADHLRRFSELAPEYQTQNKPNSERGKDRFRWIFAHILLRIVLKCANAIPRISPCLFCFAACFAPFLLCLAAIFFSHGACCRFQIFSCSARMLFT